MPEYAIGDVQGCLDPLLRLLDKIQFNDRTDRLWFVGDIINRGPQSLETLRFIKSLAISPQIVLGNHDLHLLNCIFNHLQETPKDTFGDILSAPDCEELGTWLIKQPLIIHDETFQVVMSHAGIYPLWTLEEAKKQAIFFQKQLQSEHFKNYLAALYGNLPATWSEIHSMAERLRFICNAFTRMRFCDANGMLLLDFKGSLSQAPSHYFPWYAIPQRCMITETIVFGHWAALQGECPIPNIYAIDTGCVWGGLLTALRLEDRQRLSVPGV